MHRRATCTPKHSRGFKCKFGDFVFEVREIRQILQPVKLRVKLRCMDSWKAHLSSSASYCVPLSHSWSAFPLEGAAARCRRLKEQQLHVTNSVYGLRTWFRMV